MRKIFLILFSLIAVISNKDSFAQNSLDYSKKGFFDVQIIEFPDLIDQARNRKVPIKVHLPIGKDAFPLIIFSHGGGGSWDANFAQAQHLASHGYVILALEHIGSNTKVMKSSFKIFKNIIKMTKDREEVLGRPEDVTFAINQAKFWNKTDRRFLSKFNLERVGVFGNSFGAYTSLVVAGAKPALNWLDPPGLGLAPDLSNRLVDCAVALSPHGPGEPFFVEESYRSIKIPILAITGSKDSQYNSSAENRIRGFQLWPPGGKYFIWLENADHMAFSDSSGTSKGMFRSKTRQDVQPISRAASLMFFNWCLKSDKKSESFLSEGNLKTYLQGQITNLEFMKK